MSATATADAITIRRALPAEAAELERLAALDDARPLRGTILVAEAGGELRAAWSVQERRAVAAPFERTAAAVALLRARAEQLGAGAVERRRRLGPHRRGPRRVAAAR
ncbi:MAG: hypothetical protein QOG35_849 [Solirubrobacteraceae bacterium]|nr:hypothetical protein [Solirubrobacteraceae bacterium]